MTGEPLRSERIDKWLWFARFGKTRAIAQKLVARGQVTLNGAKVRKVSTAVRVGDKVVVVLGTVKRSVTVLGLGEKRGPADEAKLLYDEPAPKEKLASEHAALPLYKPMLMREKGTGRPTKKDRRDIARELCWDDES
jgi:ribosome-associated heat shock protein Hsp15